MEGSNQVKDDPMRWVVLALYLAANIGIAIIFVSFSPITSVIADIYDVSTTWVEMCTLIIMIVYVPVTFPANYFLDEYGLRGGMIIGTGLTMLGSFIRIGAYFNFWFILVGNFVVALGQPFITNAPSKVSAFWFRPESRPFATTLGSICIPAGMMIGYAVPLIITKGDGKSQVGLLMVIQSIIVTTVAVLVYFFFYSAPKYPPSITASEERDGLKKSLKTCFRSKSFLLLLLAFSFSEGTLNSIVTMLDPLCGGKFSEDEVSLFGMMEILAGVIGSILLSQVVAKNHKYKFTVIILIGLAVVAFLTFSLTIRFELFAITGVLFALIGFLLTPTMPLSFELASELTYPTGEATLVGLMNCGGQIIGVIETQVAALSGNNPIVICFILAGGLVVGTVALSFCREEFKRSVRDAKDLDVNLSDYLK
mmetsp:Transcript_16041/g.23224  ORF Transcript_16041/g.23224 Transcript_16041/m.23224 type:complete len:423 (-) Transcript_16041:3-1271(-)|eukprot:CAMPEP_0202428310 /NCGR_PEP_ID=MMETSP1345-20130828/2349_1 /ASSEMBLY_ACC=CAM_ASM_000843 /TAXON_ID=342563 /ORGANISM="Fabrea Fabrea salina" /LENGTH=422 /DNA_ID=CAMNT_0049039263 /DNA_START=1003 /DNA_END=2271 /DNA_ORIENTATION=+